MVPGQALNIDVLQPLDDLDFGNVQMTFDLMDLFRLPEDVDDE